MENINEDSLQRILTSLNDNEKIDALNKLSMAISIEHPDSSITIAQRALNLAEKADYLAGMADGYFNMANGYYLLDEFQPTINNYFKALRIYEDLPPSKEYGIICLQLGDLNQFTGRIIESLPFYKKSLFNYDRLDHYEGKFKAANLIAYTYWMLEDYDSSHYFTNLGMTYLGSDKDPNKLATLYMHTARTYQQQFMESSDTVLLDKCIYWLMKAKDLGGLNCYKETFINYNLGSYLLNYHTADKTKEGKQYFAKTIPLVENCKDSYFAVPMVKRRLGVFSYEQGELDTAILFLSKALVLIEQELSTFSINEYINPVRAYEARWFLKRYKSFTCENLYLVYLKQGDYKQAFQYYRIWERSKEERYLEKNKNLIILLEADSENEKIQNRIDILAKDNELKALKISQSRTFNYGLAVMSIILVLVGLLFMRQNKLKNEHRSVLLEQKLLRLQMNPHFIFNALSNILKFIDCNENKKASDYLTTFSKLLRTTLESTRENMVPFEKEVSSLRNYLELQKLRYSNKFDYAIEVDKDINQEDMSIPPMLVQPFIENAIEHGIRHKKTPGRIDVRFLLKDKKILCEVEDDGVGRERAWEAEINERGGRKSLATEIIKDRIKVLNKKIRQKIKLEVIDLKSDNTNVTGTKVMIDIPYSNVY